MVNQKPRPTAVSDNSRRVLLTGATGFLGRNVLASLLAESPDTVVVCPCRVAGSGGDDAAKARVVSALRRANARLAEEPNAVERVEAFALDLAVGGGPEVDAEAEQLAAIAAAVHAKGPFTAVVHGAAKVRSWPATHANVTDLFAHNTLPGVALACVAAASGGCPIVYASTASVLKEGILDESDVCADVDVLAGEHYDLLSSYDAYGFTKLLGEAVLLRLMGYLDESAYLARWFTGPAAAPCARGDRLCLSRLPLLTPTESDRNTDDWLHRLVRSCAALGAVPSAGFVDPTAYTSVANAATSLTSRLRAMEASAGDAIACPVVHQHATKAVRVALLLWWLRDAEPRVGPLVNPAAFRYALLSHERPNDPAVASNAAAFLPLASQLPKGGQAAVSVLVADKLTEVDSRAKHSPRALHDDLVRSLVEYARVVAALPPTA